MLHMILNTHEAEGCAHVIDTALVESGLVGRTHTPVLAVIATADVTVNTGSEP